MADSDDRPDWLPAPPPVDRRSSREQWGQFVRRLPSLVFVALGIGAVMLAVASLFSREVTSDRDAAVAMAFVLAIAAGLMFALAYGLRRGPQYWFPRPSRESAVLVRGPMNTQQFFGALLRGLAAWQFVTVAVEVPQTIAIVQQLSALNAARLPLANSYLLVPVLRLAIGVLLMWKADWLAKWIYPTAPQAETSEHQ